MSQIFAAGRPSGCPTPLPLRSFKGYSAELLLMALDLEGMALSSGAACSSGKVTPSHVLKAMGIVLEPLAQEPCASLSLAIFEQRVRISMAFAEFGKRR